MLAVLALVGALNGPSSPALPTPQQVAWQRLEMGMFIHFAPNTWQGREYDDRSTPLAQVNPKLLDTDQWAQVAKDFGAKYVVLVAKHVGGFCLWQTDTCDYSIKNTPWRGGKGDVMADLAASCKRFGLGLGVYLSPRDDTFGAGVGGRCGDPERQRRYDAIYRRQLTELLTRYGPIVEVWFDGSIATEVGDILKRHAPRAMVFQGPNATIRWVGNEDGFAPYPAWNAVARADATTGVATAAHGDPDGEVWLPNEVDVSMRRPNWFWSEENAARLLSLESLLDIYYRSVGRGAQLLLNFTPDTSGRIPAADAARAKEFGDAIRSRFGKLLARVGGAARTLTLRFPRPQEVDHVVLEERIEEGERVRAYAIEARVEGEWRVVGQGSAIGNKRIHPVGPVTTDALRLVVRHSRGEPKLRSFSAYRTGAQPPQRWDSPAHVWADNAVGRWKGASVEVQLGEAVRAPGEYLLRFVPVSDAVEVVEYTLRLGGVAQPALARRLPGRSDALVLTIPQIGQPIALTATLRGAAEGSILLRRR